MSMHDMRSESDAEEICHFLLVRATVAIQKY